MKIKSLSRDAAAGALSWLLTGTVVLLVMLFSAMIVRDYGRETDRRPDKPLKRKGAVLIRALESGTRVGMGMRMHHAAAAGPAGRDGLATGRPVVRGDR